jgi:hypothetical protein
LITGTGRVGDDCVTGLGVLTRGAACAEGICDPAAGRCIVPGAAGDVCYDDLQCGPGLLCPDPMGASICYAAIPIGSPCDTQYRAMCLSGQCSADAGPGMDGGIDANVAVYGVCTPPLPDGTPCGQYDVCSGWCIAGRCSAVSPANRHFCQPPPPPPPQMWGVFG